MQYNFNKTKLNYYREKFLILKKQFQPSKKEVEIISTSQEISQGGLYKSYRVILPKSLSPHDLCYLNFKGVFIELTIKITNSYYFIFKR